MRLVARQTQADTPAGKDEFFTAPMDEAGNDVMGREDSAVRCPHKRPRVRCHGTLVTVKKGSAMPRGSEGGWQYTFQARMLQFLHEASGGQAACSRESQRSREDADRRMIAAAVTVKDGKHKPRIDNDNMRPSWSTMVERVNPGFNILQTLCVALRALTPTVFIRAYRESISWPGYC